MNIEYIRTLMPVLLDGALQSLKIFVLTLVISLPLGIPFSIASISKFPPLRWLAKLYIWVFRGTPLMLQLFFVFFCLPLISPIKLDRMPSAILTFGLNYAAYFAEIYRAGIQSIDIGQYEAAKSLGFSRGKTLRKIVFPQAIRRIIPPVSNEVITLVKDTSLVYVIGVPELLKAAKDANNRDVNPTAYFLAALIYLGMTFLLTVLSAKLEERFSRYEATATNA